MYKHVEILGGTGMLSSATIKISNEARRSIIYGRDYLKLEKIKNSILSNNVDLRILDYRDIKSLKKNIKKNISSYGDIDLMVCWIHSPYYESLEVIMKLISSYQNTAYNLIIVENHLELISKKINKTKIPENCKLQFVKLGYILEGSQKRWLTHEEISKGVIKACETEEKNIKIGII